MGLRPSSQSPQEAITKHIGTDIDNVRTVADNIDIVNVVGDNVLNSLKYLGSSATIPLSRLDGSPIEDGDYFLNTTSNSLNYYDELDNVWLDVDTEAAIEAAEASELSAIASALSATNSSTFADASEISKIAAGVSETNSSNSSTEALGYKNDSNTSAINALASENASNASKLAAQLAETNAESFKDGSEASAVAASISETNSSNFATASGISASNSATSASESLTSETNASNSASAASTSETNALNEANRAEGYADSLELLKNVMTKAEFFALAEQHKSQSAGSGFQEWGQAYDVGVRYDAINEGLWVDTDKTNTLRLGRIDNIGVGVSRTPYAITNINGVINSIQSVLSSSSPDIQFPSAPDGTKTYDSSTGTVTQHASAAIAFAAETATNKVITSRQDFAFLEVWHENISEKGVVYPLGNVQFGATAYEGVALAANGIAQGYSAFGEWDTTTAGNCAVWANLTDAQKAIFTQNPENNIYSDNGELIQVRYRVRVIEGLGDDWSGLNTREPYPHFGASQSRLKPQGISESPSGLVANDNFKFFYWGSSSLGNVAAIQSDVGGNGHYIVGSNLGSSPSPVVAHNGLCFAIPIALVQRRNIGTFDPSVNPQGTTLGVQDTNAAQSGRLWYASGYRKPTTLADCFNLGIYSGSGNYGRSDYGSISSGTSGRTDGKFYDAIYASDVKDLRMSSKKLPLAEIREKYKRMAIAGEVRGFESTPQYFVTLNQISGSGGTTFVTHDQGSGHEVLARNGGFIIIGGDAYGVYSHGNDFWVKLTKYIGGVATVGDYSAEITVGTYPYIPSDGNSLKALETARMVRYGTKSNHHQANPTWTDIIGDPANIAATFPDGVEGQWIPFIPDGGSKNFSLNRKSLGNNETYTLTDDNGVTWLNNVLAVNNTNNTYTSSTPENRVQLLHYETQAHFTQDDVNSQVLDLGGVFASSFYLQGYGSSLCSSLVEKILISSEGVNGTLTEANITQSALVNGLKLSSGKPVYTPKHAEINLDGALAVKALDYLSHDNNVAKLCYAYKEMKFDVTWGDNNQFEIADNQSILTDDNGNSVLYGTASFDTQYFIKEV